MIKRTTNLVFNEEDIKTKKVEGEERYTIIMEQAAKIIDVFENYILKVKSKNFTHEELLLDYYDVFKREYMSMEYRAFIFKKIYSYNKKQNDTVNSKIIEISAKYIALVGDLIIIRLYESHVNDLTVDWTIKDVLRHYRKCNILLNDMIKTLTKEKLIDMMHLHNNLMVLEKYIIDFGFMDKYCTVESRASKNYHQWLSKKFYLLGKKCMIYGDERKFHSGKNKYIEELKNNSGWAKRVKIVAIKNNSKITPNEVTPTLKVISSKQKVTKRNKVNTKVKPIKKLKIVNKKYNDWSNKYQNY